jgi:hypothetical protein
MGFWVKPIFNNVFVYLMGCILNGLIGLNVGFISESELEDKKN